MVGKFIIAILCCSLLHITSCSRSSTLLPRAPDCGNVSLPGTHMPWIAYLQAKDEQERNPCVGFLINDRYVLTIKVCGQEHAGGLDKVRLGEFVSNSLNETDSRNEYAQIIDVESVHRFGNDVINDSELALVRLASRVQITPGVSPICLPFSTDEFTESQEGSELVVSGWGKPSFRGRLREHVVSLITTVINSEGCSAYFTAKLDIALDASERCVAPFDCYGLLGAPLMKRVRNHWYAEGALEDFCVPKRHPPVYVNIAYYKDWIMSVIEP